MTVTRRRKAHLTAEAQSEDVGSGAEAKVGCTSEQVGHWYIWSSEDLVLCDPAWVPQPVAG